MNKELSNRVWKILPKEFKEEVKKLAQYYSRHVSALFGMERQRADKFYREFVSLFGIHNLTSDAEGEEMLTVSRKQIDALQGEIFKAIMDAHDADDWQDAAHYILDVMPRSFAALFGSKCLPGGACNVASSDVASSKLKLDRGQKCKIIGGKGTKGLIGQIVTLTSFVPEENAWAAMLPDMSFIYLTESDLEPYTEPKFRKGQYVFRKKDRSIYVVTSQVFKDGKYRYSLSNLFYEDEDGIELYKPNLLLSPMSLLVNGGQEGWGTMPAKPIGTPIPSNSGELNPQDADKQFDSIIKDGFAKERRLTIAAMAMQGYLSSNGSGDPHEIAHYALAVADALLAESQKGGAK